MSNPYTNVSDYNPSPVEWVALLVGIAITSKIGHNLLDIAVAKNWKVWIYDDQILQT